MDNYSLILSVRDDQKQLAEIINATKPKDTKTLNLLVKFFNISKKNVSEYMEAAEHLTENSYLLSDFSSITRAALLSNTIKKIKEQPEEEEEVDSTPTVQFSKNT